MKEYGSLFQESGILSQGTFPKALIVLITSAVVLGPGAVGAIRSRVLWALSFAVLLPCCLHALGRNSHPLAKKFALSVLTVCFTITVFDLVLRSPLLTPLYYQSPPRPAPWPLMPLVHRYAANVRYRGSNFGDLTALLGSRGYAEYSDLEFVTDQFGFRNKTSENESTSRGLDLILLGDSFAVGEATTQNNTWGSVLSKDHGLQVYNLSVAGVGPWEEYVNLAVEVDRLKITPRGTVVVWAIFTGNDLEDPCYSTLELTKLPWNNWLRSLVVSYGVFRYGSPVFTVVSRGLRLSGGGESRVLVRDFLDGSKLLFFSEFADRKDRKLDEIRSNPQYRCVEATVEAMSKFAASRHLTVAVVLVPTKEEVYSWVVDRGRPWSTNSEPSGFAAAFKDICQRNGVQFLDLKLFLVDASKRAWEDSHSLVWYRDDIHWNARGNKEVASAVYNNLLRSLLSDH